MATKAHLNDSTSVIVPTSIEENTLEGGAPKSLHSSATFSIEKAHKAGIQTIKERHLYPEKLFKKEDATSYKSLMARLLQKLQMTEKSISSPSMFHTYVNSATTLKGKINPLQTLLVSIHSYECEQEIEMIIDIISSISNQYDGKVRIWIKDENRSLLLNLKDKTIPDLLTGIVKLEFYIETDSRELTNELGDTLKTLASYFDTKKMSMVVDTKAPEETSEKSLDDLKNQLENRKIYMAQPENFRNLTMVEKKTLAYKLFLDLPTNTDPSQVLGVIFSTLSRFSTDKIKLLKAAEAFSFFYPGHKFTSQQILDLTLANPENQFMTMVELYSLCIELRIDIGDPLIRRDILKKANDYRCIKLVEYFDAPLPRTNYNFLWVNLDPQKNSAQNIFGKGLNPLEDSKYLWNEKEYQEAQQAYLLETIKLIHERKEDFESNDPQAVEDSFLFKVKKWMRAIPDGTFNLWYDSALVTEKARKNTFETIQKISNSTGVKLHLRDIHTLNISEKYEELRKTLHPKSPVFWRVDLLKELILHHQLKDPTFNVSAVVDVDITPLTQEELFDKSTMKNLREKGGAFITPNNESIENSFYMVNHHHPKIMESHAKWVFDNILQKLENPFFGSYLHDHLQVQLNSEGVYKLYTEWVRRNGKPLKLMDTPLSQFNSGGSWKNNKADHRNETFFLTNGQVETEGGRAISGSGIFSSEFADFEYKPLPPLEES